MKSQKKRRFHSKQSTAPSVLLEEISRNFHTGVITVNGVFATWDGGSKVVRRFIWST